MNITRPFALATLAATGALALTGCVPNAGTGETVALTVVPALTPAL